MTKVSGFASLEIGHVSLYDVKIVLSPSYEFSVLATAPPQNMEDAANRLINLGLTNHNIRPDYVLERKF